MRVEPIFFPVFQRFSVVFLTEPLLSITSFVGMFKLAGRWGISSPGDKMDGVDRTHVDTIPAGKAVRDGLFLFEDRVHDG
jgi:hypothetical protein